MKSYLKLRPVFVNSALKYGICFFTASFEITSGNLCVFFKDRKTYSEYSFTRKKWVDSKMIKLSRRESEVLMLTQNGLNREEKSKTLYVSIKTIDSNSSIIGFIRGDSID